MKQRFILLLIVSGLMVVGAACSKPAATTNTVNNVTNRVTNTVTNSVTTGTFSTSTNQ